MEMRLYLKLDIAEYKALAAMAKADLREDRDQLRYLLRKEAQERGLLTEISGPAQSLAEARGDADHGRQREVLGCLSA